MTEHWTKSWRPEVRGWSDDILPFYEACAAELPASAVIVEVGCYRGRSLLFMAEKMHELKKTPALYGVDPIVEPEILPHLLANVLATHFDARELVRLVRAPSVMAAKMFDDESIDMCFIDGDHSEPAVLADIAAWGPKMKMGGILSGHDYHDYDSVRRAVDALLPKGEVVIQETVWSWRVR